MSETKTAVTPSSPKREQSAGRGVIVITSAKVYFIVTSYVIQLLLPRFLKSAESFGLYATTMNLISILNNVLIVATVQSVSKMASESETDAPVKLRQGLIIQSAVGISLFAILFTTAPWIASFGLLDTQLGAMLQVASLVVLSYAVYAVLVGYLNGSRLFQRQARLDITFSTLRMTGILGAAWLGLGALGALGGFAAAAVAVLVVAFVMVGIGKPTKPFSLKPWLLLIAPLWLYQIFINGIMQVDLAVLKRSIAELGLAKAWSAEMAANVASRYAGYYRAAQTFAFVPYQLILSITFVIFPLISRASSKGNTEQTRAYARNAMRFSWLFLLAIAAPIAGASTGIMRVAYPKDYLVGADALGVLVFGQVAFALFVIAATVLSSAGKPMVSATIAGVALVIVIVATRTLILNAGLSDHALVATAIGTTAGAFIGLLIVGIALYRDYKTFIPWPTVLRGIFASALTILVAKYIPNHNALWAFLSMAVGFVCYGMVLLLSREITKNDFALVMRARK